MRAFTGAHRARAGSSSTLTQHACISPLLPRPRKRQKTYGRNRGRAASESMLFTSTEPREAGEQGSPETMRQHTHARAPHLLLTSRQVVFSCEQTLRKLKLPLTFVPFWQVKRHLLELYGCSCKTLAGLRFGLLDPVFPLQWSRLCTLSCKK